MGSRRYLHPGDWFGGRSLDWIDVAKGIGIILVVIGHFHPSSSPHYWDAAIAVIYTFHMPLFFTLSGYLYVQGKYPYLALIGKKVRRLALPFLCIAAIYLVIKWLAGRIGHVNYPVDAASIGALFYDPIDSYVPLLWFVQALFIIFLIYPLLRRALDGVSVLCLLLLLNAVFGSKWPVIGRALDAMPFFALGVILRECRSPVAAAPARQWSYVLLFGAIFATASALAFAGEGSLSHRYWMQALLGGAGSLMVMSLSSALWLDATGRLVRLLFKIGYYSMTIYLFHTLFESSARWIIVQGARLSVPFLLVALPSILCGIVCPILLDVNWLRRWRVTRVALLGMPAAD